MSLRAALPLSLVLLAACTRSTTPTPDTFDGSAGEAAAVDASGMAAKTRNTDVDAGAERADAAPALDLPSDGGIAALLSGTALAARLPELATERGVGLDRNLRERLTTEEAPDPTSLGALDGRGNPVGAVTLQSVVATTAIEHAERVIAGFRPRARICYSTGLQSDRAMQGKMVVTLAVARTGDVERATVASNSGLSAQVAACVARAYGNATFDPPDGGGSSTLTVTLTFAPQN